MSVCIVGNGIIGMMTAYTLSAREPGLAVKVIGCRSRVGCASLAAAAMFNSFCEIEAGTLGNAMERERFLFNKRSNALWPALLNEIAQESGKPLHRGFGTFLIRNMATDELEDKNFDAICAGLQEFHEPYHLVHPNDIENYRPRPDRRASEAVYIPSEGWVNPIHLIHALEHILSRRKNVELVDAQCERIEHAAGRVTGVVLQDGTKLPAEQVLACNGAEFTNLMNRSGLSERFQRVFYGVGCTIVLECGEDAIRNCVRTPNRGLACGLYSAPQTVSEVVVGASNHITPAPEHEPRATSVYNLLKQAMEQLNTDYYRARLIRVNTGWRPTSSDTLPLIGPTSLHGLLVATGTKRDGLHCSPTISAYLCDRIATGGSTLDMALYQPERKLTRLYSREEAIEKYVYHTMNALYQHDFVSPKNRLPEELQEHYRQEFAALHDRVGAHEWGIPLEMKDMYRYGHIQ